MALSQREKLIRIRRRTDGPGGPGPGILLEGEPGYNDFGGATSLYIGGVGAGAAALDMISANRQVERAGAQTITGQKTIAVANLRITGGANGDFLAVADNATGELEFTTPTPPGITVTTPPFTGDGATTPLNLTVADNTAVDTGTNNVLPITSLQLRRVTGDLDNLDTSPTATNLVLAINEVMGHIASLQAGVTPVGTYNAATDTVTPFPDSAAVGTTTLPQPSAGNQGWLLYVAVAGTSASPYAPTAPLAQQDQLISPGAGPTRWNHVSLGAAAVVASGVAISTVSGMTATNVQDAIQELHDDKLATVDVDGTSITGDGVTTPLAVGEIDGGTY